MSSFWGSRPVKPPSQTQLNIGITNGSGAIVGLRTDNDGEFFGIEDSQNPGRFSIIVTRGFGTGSQITITKDGYFQISHRLQDSSGRLLAIPLSGSVEILSETLVFAIPSIIFPPIPSRDAVCGVQLTFQGLPVTLQTGIYAGTYPSWFEPALQCLDAVNRQVVYKAKKTSGDTHQIIEFFSGKIYDEPGQDFQSFTSPDYPNNPTAFLNLAIEIIMAGFTPIVAYDGDDADNEPRGGPNALRQLPVLDALFKNTKFGDIRGYILFARLWDGVFYGSSPANIQAFGKAFRQLNPNGYLAIEHDTGHIPLGNATSDWQPDGAMSDYDVLMSEFENWPTTGDATWQIAGRLLGPAYIRPAAQSSEDDPRPPWYLSSGNTRGQYYAIAFEWGAYPGVRHQLSAQQFTDGRNYYKSIGYKYVC